MLPAASAAAALAQLHNHKLEVEWESGEVRYRLGMDKLRADSLAGLDVRHGSSQTEDAVINRAPTYPCK